MGRSRIVVRWYGPSAITTYQKQIQSYDLIGTGCVNASAMRVEHQGGPPISGKGCVEMISIVCVLADTEVQNFKEEIFYRMFVVILPLPLSPLTLSLPLSILKPCHLCHSHYIIFYTYHFIQKCVKPVKDLDTMTTKKITRRSQKSQNELS